MPLLPKRVKGLQKRSEAVSVARAELSTKAAAYIRVSTEEQATHGHGIDSQRRSVQSFAASQGYDLVEEFIDPAVSGATKPSERPGFGRLLELGRAQAFSVLVVYKFDRLARNISFSIEAVGQLDQLGIAIRSVTEPLDTGTPMGRTIFAIFAGMAEQERQTITERTHGGRREKATKGGFAGGAAPLGYQIDRSGGIEIVEAEATTIQRIFVLRAGGLILQAIADRLNAERVPTKRGGKWRPSQVSYILDNPKEASIN